MITDILAKGAEEGQKMSELIGDDGGQSMLERMSKIQAEVQARQAKAAKSAEVASAKSKKYSMVGNILNAVGAAATMANKAYHGLQGKRGIAIGEPLSGIGKSLLSQGKDYQTTSDRQSTADSSNSQTQAALLGGEMKMKNNPLDQKYKQAQIDRIRKLNANEGSAKSKKARVQQATMAMADFKAKFPDANKEQFEQMMMATFPDVFRTPAMLGALSTQAEGQFKSGYFRGDPKTTKEMDTWQQQYLGNTSAPPADGNNINNGAVLNFANKEEAVAHAQQHPEDRNDVRRWLSDKGLD